MKKNLFSRSLFLILGLCVLFAAVSSGMIPAENGTEEGPVKIKGKLSGVIRWGVATITSFESGSAFWYGGGFLLRTSEKIGVEFIIDHFEVPVYEDLAGLGSGTLSVTPVLFSLQWRFLPGTFEPHADVGVGFYFFDYVQEHDSQEESHDYVVTDRFALHLGGGVDFRVSQRLVLFGELRYSLIKTWIQERAAHHVAPEDQDIFNLNTLCFGLGIRYLF